MRHYRREFSQVCGVTLLESKEDRESACWLFTLLAERRDDFSGAPESRRARVGVSPAH